MAVFHYLHLRAFAHETEDPDRVRRAVREAAQAEALPLEETPVEGSHKNRILILDAEQKSAPAVKRLFARLAADDPDGFARLRTELPRRLDENLNLHLRLDKQQAFLGRIALAASDDAITLRGKVRTFASKRNADPMADALSLVEGLLAGLPPGAFSRISPRGENIQE